MVSLVTNEGAMFALAALRRTAAALAPAPRVVSQAPAGAITLREIVLEVTTAAEERYLDLANAFNASHPFAFFHHGDADCEAIDGGTRIRARIADESADAFLEHLRAGFAAAPAATPPAAPVASDPPPAGDA